MVLLNEVTGQTRSDLELGLEMSCGREDSTAEGAEDDANEGLLSVESASVEDGSTVRLGLVNSILGSG